MPGSRSAGIPVKKASKAAKPPADAPRPTMGKVAAAGAGDSEVEAWRDCRVRLFFNSIIFGRAPRGGQWAVDPIARGWSGWRRCAQGTNDFMTSNALPWIDFRKSQRRLYSARSCGRCAPDAAGICLSGARASRPADCGAEILRCFFWRQARPSLDWRGLRRVAGQKLLSLTGMSAALV